MTNAFSKVALATVAISGVSASTWEAGPCDQHASSEACVASSQCAWCDVEASTVGACFDARALPEDGSCHSKQVAQCSHRHRDAESCNADASCAWCDRIDWPGLPSSCLEKVEHAEQCDGRVREAVAKRSAEMNDGKSYDTKFKEFSDAFEADEYADKGNNTGKEKGKGKAEGKGKGKGKGKDEGKDEGKDKGKGKGKDKGKGKGHDEGKDNGKGKGKDEGKGKGKDEGKGKGKDEARGEGKGKDKGNGNYKGKGKGEAERKGKGKGKGEGRTKDGEELEFENTKEGTTAGYHSFLAEHGSEREFEHKDKGAGKGKHFGTGNRHHYGQISGKGWHEEFALGERAEGNKGHRSSKGEGKHGHIAKNKNRDHGESHGDHEEDYIGSDRVSGSVGADNVDAVEEERSFETRMHIGKGKSKGVRKDEGQGKGTVQQDVGFTHGEHVKHNWAKAKGHHKGKGKEAYPSKGIYEQSGDIYEQSHADERKGEPFHPLLLV
eukprot:TRINITY_DN2075_c0_g1_i2.p1 TRINITY_DN2075_c0_g1~~TRINITY_DN2075_c0_g1_i2.p1  ORF type:complete len:493 (+),score=106.03 TRINITY_DN2075_c0_g1_i2:61-1539(+)